MALRLLEGWDAFGSTTSGAMITDEKWARAGSIGTTRVAGRNGGVALQLSGASEAVASVQLFDPEPQTIIVGFALRPIDLTSAQPIFEARINSNQRTRITLNTDGTLSVARGNDSPTATGSTVLSVNTWYYIELKTFVADSGNGAGQGTYELKIDGAVEVSGTASMVSSGRNGVNLITFNSGGSFGVTAFQVDDVYVCDDQGSVNNDYLGDIRVATLFPNGDDTQAWTTSSGSDHYSLVNENPADGDATYVETSTTNAFDIFDYDNFADTGTIHGVQVNSIMKGTGPATVKNVVKSDVTTDDTTSPTFSYHSASYLSYWSIHELDPNTSAPWEIADLDAAKFGVKQLSNNARLTRQYVEVAYTFVSPGGEIEESVESVMSLGQALNSTYEEDASSVLSLVQTLSYVGPKPVEPDDSEISFNHTLSYIGPKTVEVETIISFTDRAYKTAYGEAESELTLVDEAEDESFIFIRLIPEGMYPGGIFNRSNLPTFPGDLLSLVQSVAYAGSQSRSVASAMALTQTVGVSQAVINQSITTLLSFSTTLGRPIDASASSVLSLVQDVERVQSEKSILALSSVAVATPVKKSSSTLALNHTVERILIAVQSMSSSLDIGHSVLYYNARLAQECTYSPQVGFGSSGIQPPPTVSPTLGTATLTLTYPEGAPTMTVVLRNPNFGNVDRFNFMRIKTTTRGGTLLIYANPNWPKERVFSVSVDALRQSQIDDLKALLTASLGREVGFLNHENRYWKGLITTPDLDITQTGRGAYSVSFEFEDTGPDVELPPP